MENIGNLFNMLLASEAMIERSAVRIPGYEAPLPFRVDLNTLRYRQRVLKQRLLEFQQWQAAQTPGNLGAAPLIIAAGAGAVLGLSAIGGWIYKHFTDAKKIDAQTSVYQDLRAEGTDSRDAAQIVFGGSTDWGVVMGKVVTLSVIGAGVFLFAKLAK